MLDWRTLLWPWLRPLLLWHLYWPLSQSMVLTGYRVPFHDLQLPALPLQCLLQLPCVPWPRSSLTSAAVDGVNHATVAPPLGHQLLTLLLLYLLLLQMQDLLWPLKLPKGMLCSSW
jgi:hypothetical protein